MNKKETDGHILYPNESNVTTEKQGEIPCLIVYSDKIHVSYINNILNPIRELLPELGFNPIFLSEEVESLNHYGYSVEQLASRCPLGIVILDGLRPNVLFELGILFGKNKSIIVIQDEEAKISVKSFYNNNCISAGLTQRKFDELKEPTLGNFKHVSDLKGLHSIHIDRRADLNHTLHPKNILKSEINKLKTRITDEYNRILLESEPLIKGEHFENFQSIVTDISDFYIKSKEYKVEHLDYSLKKLEEIEKRTKIQIPQQIYSNIAALYTRLSENQDWQNTTLIVTLLNKAINIYIKIIEKSTTDLTVCKSQLKLGNIYFSISIYTDKSANCKKSINAYQEALKFYTLDKFPMDYTMTQINLSNSFSSLAEIENSVANCNNAIHACHEALKVRTYSQFPESFASIQINLGTAYSELANHKDKLKNLNISILAYKEALKIFTYEEYPIKYSLVCSNLGETYNNISDIRDSQNNLEKAIKYCNKSLSVRTIDKYPIEFAMTNVNLGNAYFRLGKIKETLKNYGLSLNLYKQALKVFTIDSFPMHYAKTHKNLGYLYLSLATKKNLKQNCEKAIVEFNKSLSVYTFDEFPINHDNAQQGLKLAKEFYKDEKHLS